MKPEQLAALAGPLFEAPNLDCLSVDPSDYEAASWVLCRLATYARVKGEAMQQRLRGDVTQALISERVCDGIYKALPKWARW